MFVRQVLFAYTESGSSFKVSLVGTHHETPSVLDRLGVGPKGGVRQNYLPQQA